MHEELRLKSPARAARIAGNSRSSEYFPLFESGSHCSFHRAEATVDLKAKSVLVTALPAAPAPEEMAAAVSAVGYAATVAPPPSATVA